MSIQENYHVPTCEGHEPYKNDILEGEQCEKYLPEEVILGPKRTGFSYKQKMGRGHIRSRNSGYYEATTNKHIVDP